MLFHENSVPNKEIFDATNLKRVGGAAASMFDTEVRGSIDELSYQHSRVTLVRDPSGSLAFVITGKDAATGEVKTDKDGQLLIIFHADPSENGWNAKEVYIAIQEHYPPVLGIVKLLENKISGNVYQDDYLREIVALLKKDYQEKYTT